MIRCGWCGRPTKPETCERCGREPETPWAQRGMVPPPIDERHEAIARAIGELRAEGRSVTVDAIAERLDVAPRTVRRWQQMTA